MKVRLKPAFRSRLLATGLSLATFVAIVSGFIQESASAAPELSVKSTGTDAPLSPEVLVTQNPAPTVESTPTTTASASPTSSPAPTSSAAPTASPVPTTSTAPSAKPKSSASANAIEPSPTATQRPSAQPTKSAAPTVNPSPSSLEGVAPATPVTPVTPEVAATIPEPTTAIFTCMSPGGNTRDPSGSSCPTKWGYVLTQV